MVVGDIRNIKSAKRDLRKFGFTVGIGLAVFGALSLWRGKSFYDIFFYVAGAFLLLAAAVPIVLKPIQKVWMTLAILLGWVMTRVILSILFFVIVTPIGLLSRLFGKGFLDLKFDAGRESYWVHRDPSKTDRNSCEKQF